MLCPVINVEAVVPQKADQNNIEFARYLHSQARWRAHCGNHRQTSHYRFLQQFKTGPSGEQKQIVAQGSAVCEKLRPQQLIHRIMAAHILPQHLQVSCRIEKSSSVQAAGHLEDALRMAQPIGQ
jgi:hypothetical protein